MTSGELVYDDPERAEKKNSKRIEPTVVEESDKDESDCRHSAAHWEECWQAVGVKKRRWCCRCMSTKKVLKLTGLTCFVVKAWIAYASMSM